MIGFIEAFVLGLGATSGYYVATIVYAVIRKLVT